MAKSKRNGGKQHSLTSAGFYPMLTKTATAIGKYASVGIVNEFALMYNVRHSFPLHYIVFKQTASHLPHEGNSEQLFSRSGALSDNNGKMDPTRLAVWTSIGVNYSTYKPTNEKILERLMLKFSKGGKTKVSEMHQDDLGLLDPEEVLVQAGNS